MRKLSSRCSFFCKLTLGWLLASGAAVADTKTELPPFRWLSKAQRTELEGVLTQKLQQYASNKPYYIQLATVPLSVNLDLETGAVIVEVGASFGPDSDDPDMEDLETELSNVAGEVLEGVAVYRGLTFRYGGKDFYYYHPEDWHPPVTEPRVPRDASKSDGAAIQATQPKIVVSPGHGLFRLYNGDKFSWVYQRPMANGVREDRVTQEFARELVSWLPIYSQGAVVERTRSTSGDSDTSPGGDSWNDYAARYHLEAIYPDHPEIWHNRPDDKSRNREYKEDIRSRPLFANHIGADAILHLHTNASSNPSTNGAQILFAEGSTESEKLADSILCAMNEAIKNEDAYKNFKVASKSQSGKHGENRLARMPSALLEIGFHTNPDDAALIQDMRFQDIAMRGAAKGYWIYSLGKTCEPFEAVSVSDVQGPQDVDIPIPVIVNIRGFPRTLRQGVSSIYAMVEPVSCPSGVNCHKWMVNASSKHPDGPFEYRHMCGGPGKASFTARYRVTLRDRDDLLSSPLEYNITCQPQKPNDLVGSGIYVEGYTQPTSRLSS
jgi:N-acetylmuramoyl-L-alanine amidase